MQRFQELPIVVSGFASLRLSSTISQSSSVIFVSMAGSLMPVTHESKKFRFGNPYRGLSISVHRS
jgi:hypothetical protein